MSFFQEFITVIVSELFSSDEEPKNKKIYPKVDIDDVELGNISRKVIEMHKKEHYAYCEFKNIIQNPDLELGFGPIVEFSRSDIIVDMNAFEKCGIYENYISFMESINYLVAPFKDREAISFKGLNKTWNTEFINNEFQAVMHIDTKSMGIRLNKTVIIR